RRRWQAAGKRPRAARLSDARTRRRIAVPGDHHGARWRDSVSRELPSRRGHDCAARRSAAAGSELSMSLTRTLLFFLALALIATLALLVDGVALFAQTQSAPAAQSDGRQPPQQTTPTQQAPAQQPSQAQPQQPSQRAQPQQPQEPTPDGFRFKSSVELINVSATVVDSAERFVPNLHKADFVLYEDDKLQPITHFSDERVPVSLGILLDISGSMEGEKFRNATSSIERFLRDLLGPEDEVFLYTFNDHAQMVQGWTKDRDLVMRELRRQYPA